MIASAPSHARKVSRPSRSAWISSSSSTESGATLEPRREADSEPFALEPTQGVSHRREADAEPAGELLEPEALARRELEPPDLGAERAVDPSSTDEISSGVSRFQPF